VKGRKVESSLNITKKTPDCEWATPALGSGCEENAIYRLTAKAVYKMYVSKATPAASRRGSPFTLKRFIEIINILLRY